MTHIVVSDDQAQIIHGATGSIEIRDGRGNCLGYVAHGFEAEDVAIAKERLASEQPRYTTSEVKEHIGARDTKCPDTRSSGRVVPRTTWRVSG